jgi:hypothetical protein
MKKFAILGIAAFLVVALTLPVCAIENEFGGYWRTRAFSQKDFSGDDTESLDYQAVDTRTRLYYTAKFSDNLKLVNKFEMDAEWGDNTKNSAGDNGYGDIGADGVRVEVKNSYVDFKLGGDLFRGEIGVLDFTLAKGFLIDDDAAGFKAIFKAAEGVYLPLIHIKANEGGIGKDKNDGDVDGWVFYPTIFLTKDLKLKPHVAWLTSDDYGAYERGIANAGLLGAKDLDIYTFGLELDGTVGPVDLGLTGIYETGKIKEVPVAVIGETVILDDLDIDAYMMAASAGVNFGPVNVHGQAIYASGDDKKDTDLKAFINPVGASYYWAEIMGYGIFDNQVPSGSMGDQISNLMAFNAGVTFTAMEKVKLTLDVWHALLAEENEAGDDEMGTEIDFVASMPVVGDLSLDLVGAYLFAGDVIGDEDPIELGAQLSLSF